MKDNQAFYVVMQPPKRGETGWWVVARDAPAAYAEVRREMDGGGWIADHDHSSAPDEEDMIAITVMPIRCPKCGSSVHQCATGDDGCLHCDECTYTWLQCADNCAGWDVFDSDTYGLEIERCDDCHAKGKISDEVFEAWPEAQLALAAAIEEYDVTWFESMGRCIAEVAAKRTCPDVLGGPVPHFNHPQPVGL